MKMNLLKCLVAQSPAFILCQLQINGAHKSLVLLKDIRYPSVYLLFIQFIKGVCVEKVVGQTDLFLNQ